MTLGEIFKTYFDKRMLWFFGLGCSSGFPWVLHGSTLNAWLKDGGISRTEIGLLGLIGIAYAFNFLWAPFLDRTKIPIFNRLGQRRSWILLSQVMILLLTIAMAFIDAPSSLIFAGLVGLGIAVCSATQDIAIDGFRVDHLRNSKNEATISAASTMATTGWWSGFSFPAFLAFVTTDSIGWNQAYILLAGIMALWILITFLSEEPITSREQEQLDIENIQRGPCSSKLSNSLFIDFSEILVTPLTQFLRQHGFHVAIAIFSFIFLFKIGEAFLGRMSIIFYKELFSNADIGWYSKLYGGLAFILFSILGGLINVKLGILKGLFVGGITMAMSNLAFTYLAFVGPNATVLMFAILVDNFTTAFSTIVFVTFLTSIVGSAFSATQYALLASIGNFGRTVLASSGGWFVDATGGNWALFFTITAIMVTPSLVILWLIKDRLGISKN
jgi:PAT family beta-lactamase induction signal transducer AmpG